MDPGSGKPTGLGMGASFRPILRLKKVDLMAGRAVTGAGRQGPESPGLADQELARSSGSHFQ